MFLRHRRHRREADQASEDFAASREALAGHIEQQRERWRQRYPWLLPLSFVAGLLMARFRPGQKLWQLAQGLMVVGDWVSRRDPVYRRPPQ